jgi:hypothetical protein
VRARNDERGSNQKFATHNHEPARLGRPPAANLAAISGGAVTRAPTPRVATAAPAHEPRCGQPNPEAPAVAPAARGNPAPQPLAGQGLKCSKSNRSNRSSMAGMFVGT